MSVKYRNQNGQETIIAGLTPGGDLEAGAVATRKVASSIPATAANGTGYIDITFDEPMPDNDFLIEINPGDARYNFRTSFPTANGFRLNYYNTSSSAIGTTETVNITVTKTYTVQHAAQNAEDIAAIKQAMPAGAGAGNKLVTASQLTSTTTPIANDVADLKDLVPTSASITNQLATSNDIAKDATPTAGSTKLVESGGVKTALDAKQDTLTFDNEPTAGSNNPVTSDGIYDALGTKATQVEVNDIVNIYGSKNLLNTSIVAIPSGLLVTLNKDKSVTINGTNTSAGELRLFSSTGAELQYLNGCILSGITTGSNSTYFLRVVERNSPWTHYARVYTEEQIISGIPNDNRIVDVGLYVYSNQTFNSFTFYPMIRLGTIVDSTYQPYAMTNQQLTQIASFAQNVSNPNLLDNPWFTINQRGFNNTSGGGTDSYRFDRWRGTYGYDATNNIPAFTEVQYAIQRLEPNVKDFLNGKVLTASVMYSDGTIESGTFTYYKQPSAWITVSNINKVYVQIGYNATASNILNGSFCITNRNTDLSIKAVKLELGTISTLINDVPPNYQQELAKCQRYFQRISQAGSLDTLCMATYRNDYTLRTVLPLTVPMRIAPSVTVNGTVSDYTNSGLTMNKISQPVTNGGAVGISFNISKSGVTWNDGVSKCITPDNTDFYIDFSADL